MQMDASHKFRTLDCRGDSIGKVSDAREEADKEAHLEWFREETECDSIKYGDSKKESAMVYNQREID